VSLPGFNADGELPIGLHAASLQEAQVRFGVGSAQRKALALRLERIHHLATGTGHLARVVVFGSFITDKLDPNDVDIFLLMEDSFEASNLAGDARTLSITQRHRITSARACSGSAD
jgi:hypothetical protein